MVHVLRFLAALLAWLRSSQARREAEILYLRQQLIVLKRSAPARPRLKATDRLIFVCLYRLFPSLIDASIVFQPETLLRWHRRGFRLFWRWKSLQRVGRPALSANVRSLVRRISRENPLWGAPRIHGELLKLGIEIAQSTVAKYMVRRRGPPSQGWKTFIRNHGPDIAAIDLFVVRTIGFKLLYGLAIIHLERRRLVWTNVTANPTSEWIARQITEAFPWDQAPSYLIRDRDSSYGVVVRKRIRAMGIRDRPTAPRSPWQNGYIERLIGSSARSGENAWTMSWSWARPIYAGSSAPTPTITIAFALIWLSTRTPLLAVGRRQLDHSQLSHSSAACITNMSGWLKW
jgi:hypothetical protein